jgi:D-cysteine desulfhydrase
MGWSEVSPVVPLPELAERLGLAWLGAKRDDAIGALHGGTKVRKLDHLLAVPPFRDAPSWSSVGAIGSGHLVALTAAATRLKRRLVAECFWEPVSDGVLSNLAFIASGPTEVHYHRNRAWLLPHLLTPGGPVRIPPGATHPASVVGLVAAGLELGEQVAAGVLPEPDWVVLPLGTCGTAAGIALGMALAGLRTRVWAVAAVEWPFSRAGLLQRLMADTQRWLAENGVSLPKVGVPPVRIDRTQLGAGYGLATPASVTAAELGRAASLPLEPIYSGKAMAALMAKPPAGANVLFWVTPHRGGLPQDAAWQQRLPSALQARLDGGGGGFSRRAVLVGAAGLAATGTVGWRLSGYPELPWQGAVLGAREAAVLIAAAAAWLPAAPGGALPGGVAPLEVARTIDAYLVGAPAAMVIEVHALLALVEHGTLLGGELRRLTALSPADRAAFLTRLGGYPQPLPFAARGLRDLLMLGLYADPRTWPGIGYEGPLLGPEARPDPYAQWVAAPGDLPRSAR